MGYDKITIKNCTELRKTFGTKFIGRSYALRHKAWAAYVIRSKLTDFEKEACIKEFLNPNDMETRYRKKLG